MTASSCIAAIERIKMLRNCSKVRFGEAAARRREVGSMSGVGRERLTNVWCINAMLQSGERLL